VPEPPEGAHTDYDLAAENLRHTLKNALDELGKLSAPELIEQRYEKFRRMGNFAVQRT
jgi:acetyl-CoA carboxylase carboxyl transferase subunit alpha